MALEDDLGRFSTLVEALRPSLGRVVIVGGWATHLYRYRREAALPEHLPLFTKDTDVALSPRQRGAGNIKEQLVAHGFRAARMGDDRPPVTHYHLGPDDEGFYAEFLTPLSGGEHRRDGRPDVTERISGIVAQKLRYLEVLLIEPWIVRLDASLGFRLVEPADVRVANPVSYIAQKLLIHSRRSRANRAKDALYIHDTVELFGPSLADLKIVWRDNIRPGLPSKTARRVEALAAELFAEVSDTLRDAAPIASDRRLSAESMRRVCELGLREIFE